MKTSIREGSQTMSLSGSLEIYDAEETRQAILAHLGTVQELVLDLSGVESCDVAGAQILCAARQSAVLAGKPYRFEPINSGLAEAWTGLGLSLDLFKPSHS